MFLAFRICARPIFSEKGKDIFLFGVLPSKYSGRWRGFNSDSVLPKLFSGEKDLAKTRLIYRPQKGVWGMNAGGQELYKTGGIKSGIYKK